MIYVLLYLVFGSVAYASSMDMWYRIRYDRWEWYNPADMQWYFGFLAMTLGWLVLYPMCINKYLKYWKNKK